LSSTSGAIPSFRLAVSSVSPHVFVAWEQAGQIVVAGSKDNGDTWRSVAASAGMSGIHHAPEIVAFTLAAVLTWEVRRPSGAVEVLWAPLRFSGPMLSLGSIPQSLDRTGAAYAPLIAGTGDSAFVVAYLSGTDKIYGRRTSDGGLSWSPAQRLNPSGSAPVDSLRIASTETGRCAAVWVENSGGHERILGTTMDSFSAGWAPTPVLLSTNPGPFSVASDPQLCLAGEGFRVAWQDNRDGSFAIFSSYYSPSQGWSPDRPVGSGAGSAIQPSIAAHGDNVLIAWVGVTPASGIFYATSSDSGNHFTMEQRADDASSPSPLHPAVAMGVRDEVVMLFVVSTGLVHDWAHR